MAAQGNGGKEGLAAQGNGGEEGMTTQAKEVVKKASWPNERMEGVSRRRGRNHPRPTASWLAERPIGLLPLWYGQCGPDALADVAGHA
nr:hypothetical protein Iba_chr10fCG5980 [Ipomoea batatas]